MKQIFFVCMLMAFSWADGKSEGKVNLIEIITSDDVEYIGEIVTEDDSTITIKSPIGIKIQIPTNSILSRSDFNGDVRVGKVWRSDPNKSMYLFAPSAYPIESGKSYCRDFCLFFPSINFGFGNVFSTQFGAFYFPGIDIDEMPIVASGKFSFLNLEKIKGAAGIMYVSIPDIMDEGFGTGFTFVTGTVGDRFTHASASLGWGFVQYDGEWEFMERPILVFAGNSRASNTLALVAEVWLPPEMEFIPIMFATRFFGRRISVDLGALWSTESEGLPMPLINFTYQLK